jgi:carboxymethylenebutenolidase
MEVVLKEKTVTLDRDGQKLPVFCVEPEEDRKLPAIIVLQEIFGVDDHLRDVSRRFARQGMRAFAPDLFATSPNFPADPAQRKDLDTMRKCWMSIPDSKLISDLEAVFQMIVEYPGVLTQNIGAIGYCMGGAIGFMLACSEPRLAWIIDYYGRIRYGATSDTKPKHPIEYAANLKCPLLGIFAGKDELITAEHREELAGVLKKANKSFQITIYEGALHAFFNDQRPHYNEEVAKDAWRLTLDFIATQSKHASEAAC